MVTKKGRKTLNFLGLSVKLNPVKGSIVKPVIIQDVMESGTCSVRVVTFVFL